MQGIIYKNGSTNGTNILECEEFTAVWICSIAVFIIFAFPGALVILMDTLQKRKKETPFTPYDVFMINLTFMDVVYSVSLQIGLIYDLITNFEYFYIFGFLNSFCVYGRPLLLTCISLETYMAVVHPVPYRARKSLTPRILIIIGVWIVTIGFGFDFNIRRIEVYDNVPMLFLTVTLSVIVVCDFSVFWALRKPGPGRKTINPHKKKALQLITDKSIIICITYFPFLIEWLLYMIMNLDASIFNCTVLIPVLCINMMGNAISVILHVSNLGKLDWLMDNACFCFSVFTI